MEKVYVDDLNRCQGQMPDGNQCRNKTIPNGTRCPAHGGGLERKYQEVKSFKNYNLAKHQYKLDEKLDSTGIKSLRDEIGILRIILEDRLLKAFNNHELILHSGPIAELAVKIEKLVVSCHKLEASMGMHLDKAAILTFASTIITIISGYLKDDNRLPLIADDIIASIKDES